MEVLGERSEAIEYFAAIEEDFGRRRGQPLLLAPRDVALVKQWHEAGVPLRVVLKALEAFFAREGRREKPRRRAPTLAYCERDVYELWEEWKGAHLGETAEDGVPAMAPGAVLRAHLEASSPALRQARASAERSGARRLTRALDKVLAALPERLQAAEAGAVTELERDLAEAEARVQRAARLDLGEAAVERLRAEVQAQVEPFRERIEPKAYAVLLAKTEDRAVLQRFAVPRIALFSF